MNRQVVYNEYGEPIFVDNVRDMYEEEEAWCEEMQMRSEDPIYAMQQEQEAWYRKACLCFEEQGIDVPDDVRRRLAEEMRKKKEKLEEEQKLAEAQPAVDFINSKLPNCGCYARYNYPTPAEFGYVEIDFENPPYKDEIEAITEEALKQDIYLDDFYGLYGNSKTRRKIL